MGWPGASDTVPVSSVGWSVIVTVRPAIGWPRRTSNGTSSVSRSPSTAERRLQPAGSDAPVTRHLPGPTPSKTNVPFGRVVATTRVGTSDAYESTGVAPSRTFATAPGGGTRRRDNPAGDGHAALELQHDAGDVLIGEHELRLGEVRHIVGFWPASFSAARPMSV